MLVTALSPTQSLHTPLKDYVIFKAIKLENIFIDFVNHCPWQIPNYLVLLVNSSDGNHLYISANVGYFKAFLYVATMFLNVQFGVLCCDTSVLSVWLCLSTKKSPFSSKSSSFSPLTQLEISVSQWWWKPQPRKCPISVQC